ncbi:hypothetical protein, partial [Pseudothauera lacus]
LTEEGLGWCLEEDPEAPAGHRLLLFADSATLAEDDTSASALGKRDSAINPATKYAIPFALSLSKGVRADWASTGSARTVFDCRVNKHRGGLLGTGLLATGHRNTWGEVVWKGHGASTMEAEKAVLVKDNGTGSIELSNGVKLKIADPDAPGDGTVLLCSGEAPGTKAVCDNLAALPRGAPPSAIDLVPHATSLTSSMLTSLVYDKCLS